MEVSLTHISGWNGGEWRYNGLSRMDFRNIHGFDPSLKEGMTGTVEMLGWEHPVVVASETLTVEGVDYDHGHEYSWSYEEPTFSFQTPGFPSLPASLIWKNSGIITLEMS